MKKNIKILILALCLTVLSAVFISANAAEIVDSGKFGSYVTWTLDDEGTFTLSGRGSMYHKNYSYEIPWKNHWGSIKKAIIEEGITGNLAYYAFYNCSNLTEVTISSNITRIGAHTFSGCSSLKSIKLPAGLKQIYKGAFENCTGLTAIDIPESVNEIQLCAFSGCSGITEITIPEGVTQIDSFLFEDCTKLKSVNLPSGITYIYSNAFDNCISLESIDIPEGVRGISDYAFRNCNALVSISLPSTIKSIGRQSFASCKALEKVSIADIGAWCKIDFYSYESNPFYYTKKLYLNNELVTDIVIPEGIETIKDYCFNVSANSITIPTSVTTIEERAFYGSSTFKDVYYKGTEAQWNILEINPSYNYSVTKATIHFLGGMSGETMLDENFKEVPIPENALIVAIFRKNATGDIIEEEAYGINFEGTNYPGAVEVPVDGIWVIKLVDPGANILTSGQKYTYSVFTNGQTIADNLTYTVK